MSKLPDRITVNVYPAEDLPGQFLAAIPEIDVITQGNSVADAVFMASDCLRIFADECASTRIGKTHCWCRHVTMTAHGSDPGEPGMECCYCHTAQVNERPA